MSNHVIYLQVLKVYGSGVHMLAKDKDSDINRISNWKANQYMQQSFRETNHLCKNLCHTSWNFRLVPSIFFSNLIWRQIIYYSLHAESCRLTHFHLQQKSPFEAVSVIAHICSRTLWGHLRCTHPRSITYVSVEFCEQSAEQTEMSALNMHECRITGSRCIGVGDFLPSHYHKLLFIAIVARRWCDVITQSCGK